MLEGKRIAVVVPCYNEEKLLPRVVQTMPDYVDGIFVVDDCSRDATSEVALELARTDSRVVLLRHEKNGGVGASIATGYMAVAEAGHDVAVVMAGDAQMDPDDMPALLKPLLDDVADYAKGNRLFTGDAWNIIPRTRFLGNAMLSLLTKIASGYWHVADSQCGYTAINRAALKAIRWREMYPRYGQPNDLLVRLNIHNFRVRDVPIKPIYGVGEKSGVKPIRMIPHFIRLLWRLFWLRMTRKYVIQDFHPLVLFYTMGIVLLPLGVLWGSWLLGYRIAVGPVADTSVLLAVLLMLMGSQFLLFGMWFDMEQNRSLR